MNKNRKKRTIIILIIATVVIAAAVVLLTRPSDDEAEEETTPQVNVPAFNAGNAYRSIVEQCDFGPRVPGTPAQLKCADYIASAFRKLGYHVIEQHTTVTAYDGTPLRCINIFATSDTVSTSRIMLTAHWDSRPWADHDPVEANHKRPVMAANDGASGVAVMLEIARVLHQQKPGVTVDFACLDVEDYGMPEWDKTGDEEKDEASWCLGTQYFAAHLPLPSTPPLYAVNLDMVGGRGARFYQEGFSKRYAPGIVAKVWDAAARAGYASTFPPEDGGYVTDDHLPLNEIAAIPTVDIIPCYKGAESSFGPTWHTTQDTPANIDTTTLKAVGQTMLQLIYNEQ